MKKLIPLILILLLCGCDTKDRGITNVSGLTPPSETTLPAAHSLYDPYSTQERRTAGALKTYVLPMEDAYGIRSLGEGILVFSGTDTTTLTLLKGDPLVAVRTISLDHHLSQWDPSVQIWDHTLSFFDPVQQETVVMAEDLTVIRRLSCPENAEGIPLFCQEQNSVYYSTGQALYVWDLESGRHKLLRNTPEPLDLTGLHCSGSILRCQKGTEQLFLSTDSGQLLHSHPNQMVFDTYGAHYYGVFSDDFEHSMVFGIPGEPVQALNPKDPEAQCLFLPQGHAALTVSTPADNALILDHYDLSTGLRTASVSLGEKQEPMDAFSGHQGHVYLLAWDPEYGRQVLYLWNTRHTTLRDSIVYTAPHYTRESPDTEGLEACRAYADTLETRYGVRIRLWQEAIQTQPWDYDLESEYRPEILMRQLQQLEDCLSHYPAEILSQTAAHFASLNICLVRSITGTPESGQQDTATGIQFLKDSEAYVVIAAGPFSDRALYHELYHVMETHIFGNSIALDQWNSLNPSAFSYDYSYIANKTRDSGVYLRHETQSFIDTYSMSYPKEDRARILEYAMMPGNRELFQAQTLQRKLRTLCAGIREAYGLEDCTETFLWEQYLDPTQK